MALATLGGGCFWCLEAVFQPLQGVSEVVSGYAGGSRSAPTYRDVCSGTTGHAEVVQITFEPATLPYRDLLDIFFAFHDPTTLDRQGADVGSQYRSVIFTHSPEQVLIAGEVIEELQRSRVFDDTIVTTVEPLTAFYPGELYHQNYYQRNASQPYCRAVISPKLAKLRSAYRERLKR